MRMTLRIVVEGHTEGDFVRDILQPHLDDFSVGVSAHVVNPIEKSGNEKPDGINKYAQAEKDINLWLNHDNSPDARVSTMLDLYELPKDFPGYSAAEVHDEPYQRVKALEDAMADDIDDSRFIPYIQLHEFEALLLTDPRKFESWFSNCPDGIANLVEMVAQFQSPEHVNRENSPSKRIDRELLNYYNHKRLAGLSAAKQIGLPTLRAKCAHFAEWLGKLESLGEQI